MNCEICHKEPQKDGIAIFRVNPLGEIGIWRCWQCLTPEQRGEVDPETKRITDVIQGTE